MATYGDRILVCQGRKLAIVAAKRDDASCPSKEFLDGLSVADRSKVLALFQRMAEHGLIQDRQKFKVIDTPICEFKARGKDTGLRVTCYRDGAAYILLHGFFKKEDDIPPGEILRAMAIYAEDCRRNERRKPR